jgi:hypothetical protein
VGGNRCNGGCPRRGGTCCRNFCLVEREALKKVSRVEAKNIVVLASAREDDDGFIRKITLLEGELVA